MSILEAAPTAVNAGNLPRELKDRKQWVGWKYEKRDGKPTKVPYQPSRPTIRASSTDPETWSTFEEAMAAYLDEGQNLDGIGFVFSVDDPFCGIDLDDCFNSPGMLAPWAREIVDEFATYTEVSPSGNGVKLFLKATPPPDENGKRRGRTKAMGPKGGKGRIEAYGDGRFFTTTGQRINGIDHCAEAGDALNRLHAKLWPSEPARPKPPVRTMPAGSTTLDDEAILHKLRTDKNQAKFVRLYSDGETTGYDENGGQNEADLALASMIAFYARDAATTDRIFRDSALMRPKWDERRDDSTYGAWTVAKAMDRQVFYDPNYRSQESSDDRSGPQMGMGDPDDETDEIVDRWPILDDLALYGIAGEIVMAADPHTESDRAAVLVQLLAGFANAVGRGPHWVEGATDHRLSLFVSLVGTTSSGRKGSSWKIAHYFLRHLDEVWATTRIKDGMSSGEGLIYHVRDPVMKLDKDRKEIPDDEGVKDKRLFLIESELARTLKAMNRDTNTLSPILRNAWDCNPTLSTLTKNSTNVATGAFISVVGHITKGELNDLLTKTDSVNGLGNRFLWICSRRSKNLPHGGEFFDHDWRPIIARLRHAFDKACMVGLMKRDDEANALWVEAFDDLTDPRPGILGAMLGRAEPQVMRIACVYALLDGMGTIRARHLIAALALWRYAEASARFIFGDSLGDPNAEKLLAALKKAPSGLTRSAIANDVFTKHISAKSLSKLLDDLLNTGLIHRKKRENTGGRPAFVWFAGSSCRAR